MFYNFPYDKMRIAATGKICLVGYSFYDATDLCTMIEKRTEHDLFLFGGVTHATVRKCRGVGWGWGEQRRIWRFGRAMIEYL